MKGCLRYTSSECTVLFCHRLDSSTDCKHHLEEKLSALIHLVEGNGYTPLNLAMHFCLVTRLHAHQDICGEAAHKWSLKKLAMAHRTGTVGIGQPSVIIAASSAHRADALEVCLLCKLWQKVCLGHICSAGICLTCICDFPGWGCGELIFMQSSKEHPW